MVQPADKRAAKYAAKFNPTTIAQRYTDLKTFATEAQGIQAAAMVQMEEVTKAYIEGQAAVTSPMMIPQYLAFARRIYGKQRKYGGTILVNVVQSFAQKCFDVDALNATVLVGVAALFGVVINAPS